MWRAGAVGTARVGGGGAVRAVQGGVRLVLVVLAVVLLVAHVRGDAVELGVVRAGRHPAAAAAAAAAAAPGVTMVSGSDPEGRPSFHVHDVAPTAPERDAARTVQA